MTAYEIAVDHGWERDAGMMELPSSARDLLAVVDKYRHPTSPPHTGAWIEALETVPNMLAAGLSFLLHQTHKAGEIPPLNTFLTFHHCSELYCLYPSMGVLRKPLPVRKFIMYVYSYMV